MSSPSEAVHNRKPSHSRCLVAASRARRRATRAPKAAYPVRWLSRKLPSPSSIIQDDSSFPRISSSRLRPRFFWGWPGYQLSQLLYETCTRQRAQPPPLSTTPGSSTQALPASRSSPASLLLLHWLTHVLSDLPCLLFPCIAGTLLQCHTYASCFPPTLAILSGSRRGPLTDKRRFDSLRFLLHS